MVVKWFTVSKINIYINRNGLKQKDQFKHLGLSISSDGWTKTGILSRIAPLC